MRITGIVFVCIVALLSASPLLEAGTITIDFESLSDGDVVTNQFPGLTFSNAIALTAGVSLNEFEFPPCSGNTVIVDGGGPIDILFAAPILSFAGHFTYASPVTVAAFNGGTAPIATAAGVFTNNLALSGDSGSAPNELLQVFFATGITRIVITGDTAGGSFALDDLTYSTGGEADPVPEPATLTLLALGGAGMVWRRRACR